MFSAPYKHLFCFFILLLLASCSSKEKQPPAVPPADKDETLISYSIAKLFPHDRTAYTQGLVIEKGRLFESTGQAGSWIAEVNIATGIQDKKVILADKYFGEGITFLNNKIYQLTWQNKEGFVYDATTFKKIDTFTYEHEGWGITHDGKQLIVSDGTNVIHFKDTVTLKDEHTITVKDKKGVVKNLNELEYIEGYIYANQYLTNNIYKIDPATGDVVGRLDLAEIGEKVRVTDPQADVLNGIAYEKKSKLVLITGKQWPATYAIRIGK